jgi:cation diffusion facilitator family transporter
LSLTPESSRLTVYGAIAGNLAIAVSKFVAAAFTGSSAMISEAIHSTVDTGNGLFLLIGAHRSKKPPDQTHPFGHGKELYFWSLLVAVLIFGVGGGMSIYEGILHLIQHQPLVDPRWNYWVLGIAAVFETSSFLIALREFLRQKKSGEGFVEAARKSKDPTVFTILFEDTAALVGLALAALGIFLAQTFRNSALDAIASILIGMLLALVAVFLAYESKDLLLGESADLEKVESIKALAQADTAVERVNQTLTMHLGPNQVLLNLGLKFRRGLSVGELEQAVARLEKRIRQAHPEVRSIFIEAESLLTAGAEPAGE